MDEQQSHWLAIFASTRVTDSTKCRRPLLDLPGFGAAGKLRLDKIVQVTES
jgi:hypothetical protein